MRGPGSRQKASPWRAVAKWALLTVVALSLGGLVGTGYAVMNQPEPLTPIELARGDIWPPTTPQPIDPEHEVVTNATPRFTWTPSEDNHPGLVYELEFSLDPHFQTGVHRRVINVYDTEWQTPDHAFFTPGVTYHWRVFAIDVGLNHSPYSQVRAFTPLDVPPAPEAPELPVPPGFIP